MQRLKTPIVGIPLYAWLIGGVVFLGALVFFLRSRGTGGAAAAAYPGGAVRPTGGAPSPDGQPFPFPTGPPPPTSTGQKPLPVWQFGVFPPTNTYVWRATEQGVEQAARSNIQFPRDVMPAPLTQDILQLTGPWGTQWAKVPPPFTPDQYAQALNNGTLLQTEGPNSFTNPINVLPTGGGIETNAGQPIYTSSAQFGNAVAVA